MRLSTRARYGTRLMLELANHFKKGSLFLKDIAKKEDISEKYLSHLVIPLKAVGYISSTRGAHGGYRLAKSPNEITLKGIVNTLEGGISPVECIENPDVCPRIDKCTARNVWLKLDEKMSELLDSITLDDLVCMDNEVE